MKAIWIQLIFVTFLFFNSFGQSPEAIFNLPVEACMQESVKATNLSLNSTRFEWDLCQGDLKLTPTGKSVINVQGNVTAGADFVFDGTNWYGFATSRETNSIKRLNFGSDLNSTPTITDLGNIGNLSPWRPIDIQIVNDGGEWFGFVYGESTNLITRIEFGSSLTNTSGLVSEVILTGEGSSNCGLSILKDGGNYIVAYSNAYAIGTIKLSSIRSVPSVTEKMHTGNIPGILNFGDIKLIKHESNFFAYVPTYGTPKLYRANFGNDPLSIPAIADISNGMIGSNAPFGIDIGVDAGQYIAILCTIDGVVLRINLGNDPNQLPVSGVSIGNLGVLGNTLKISLRKHLSSWRAVTTSWNSGDFYTIEFPSQQCSEYPTILIEEEPQLKFQTEGIKYISLRSFSGNEFSESNKSINIKGITSPEINLFIEGICVQSPSQFQFESDQAITSTAWSFGDTQSSSDPNPVHQYFTSGEYAVSLLVTSENGCNNYAEKNIKIYNAPTAVFDLPAGLICTNNQFNFINTTPDSFDGNLSYQWFVNDDMKSTSRDFTYAFDSTDDQQIKLITQIPGCSSEQVQILTNLQSGPIVGFSYSGKCEDENVVFVNESSGAISSYEWQFGNGNSSTQENPSQTYADYGLYDVTLNTTGTNGCVSSLTKKLNIYSVPQTNFMIELPPFSCAGAMSQFRDLTPAMPDSNISLWQWSFGDASNGAATVKNPQYIYAQAGNYNVSLKTTTNFGCSNSVQKSIAILPSPTADFTFGPACLNQATKFTDASSGDIKSWLWSVQNNIYSSQNPSHTFRSSTAYPVTLTVTAINNCVSQISKSVSVPMPPAIDFATSSTCAGKPAEFNGISKGGNDPIQEWNWIFGDGASGNGQSTFHNYQSVNTYSVKLNAKSKSGCVYSNADEVSIINAPTANFSVPLESGAAPFTVPVTNLSTLATKYIWKSGLANQPPIEAYSPSFTYSDLGEYTIELEASNELNCKDVMQQKIYVVVPEINAAITDFQLEKIPGSTSWNPVVTLENKSNIALIDPVLYLDISGNSVISEQIAGIIKPNQSITHTFSAKIAPRSVQYACAEVKINSDLNSDDNRECVNVTDQFVSLIPYPNPAQDNITLEWISQTEEAMSVTIYNEVGQVVLSRTYEPIRQGLNQVTLDVSGLHMGIYFITYEWEGVIQNFRFSIVR